MSATRHCRHCGDAVPHDAPSAVCGRCACLPVAERGRREPGDDDDRKPTRCLHCGLVGSGEVCGKCQDLLSDLGEYDDPGVAETLVEREELAAAAAAVAKTLKPAPEPELSPPVSTASLRARLLEAGQRREYVWLAGRADLLRRCATSARWPRRNHVSSNYGVFRCTKRQILKISRSVCRFAASAAE